MKRTALLLVFLACFISYHASGQDDRYSYSGSIMSSSKITGKNKITEDGVKAYIKNKSNPAWEWEIKCNNIIVEYFKEAREEGVNVDIAIAQMLYWTDDLKKRDRVEKTCNYGGLSDIGDFKGDFKGNSTKGIRAHIQHLKAYAKEIPNRKQIIDPRFQLAYDRGFPEMSFEQVCGKWSADPRYGQIIENILYELYRFSGAL